MTSARILVVEDDRVVSRDIRQQLTRLGYTVVAAAASAEEAVAQALSKRPDLVLMDIRIEGDSDGIDAAQQIRARGHIPVIYLTAYADEETIRRATVTEPFGYLLKPFEDSQLRTAIEMALYKHAAETRLRESERRYAVTLESIGDAVISTDGQAVIRFINAVAEALTGWSRRDAIGRSLTEVFRIVNEHTREIVEDPAAKVLRLGAIVGLANHTVLLARDGREVPIDDSGAPIVDDNGQIVGVVLVFRDVSERRQTERAAALRQAHARIQLAIQGSSVGIWDFDMPDGLLENARLSALNFWDEHGDAPDSTLGFSDVVGQWHPDDRDRVVRAMRACLAGQTPNYEMVFRVRDGGGASRWQLARGVAVRDDGGRPIRFIGSSVDITDRITIEEALRQSQEELRKAKEVAEAGNRAKDEFLANVSHEIRTPMNAILGMTDLVLDSPLSLDQQQLLGIVKSSAGSLLAIINDLLDFSKIEAGRLELNEQDFSLRSVLGDAMRALATRAHRKGLELSCDVRADVPDALRGDAGRLRQVLINLVGNAIKFTSSGEVAVKVESGANLSSPHQAHLRFSVRDTGIGISHDKQATIFRAFEQADSSSTREYEGTGLGLTIAAQLVELMGGEISVDSQRGQGSTFAFTAPFLCKAVDHGTEAVQTPWFPKDMHVLIVDDNATSRQILGEWLRGWSVDTTAVADGLGAMNALWHAVLTGRPYSLVLLDARMPDTDGLTLAAAIRATRELSASRIILLTSGDRPGDFERSRQLRVNAHLLKPVPQQELLETIRRTMSGSQEVEPGPGASSAIVPEVAEVAALPLRVLVAEDNPINAQLLQRLLQKQGHAVRLTSNGRDTLARARAGRFDVLLLDLHMPELDGFQVIQALREAETATGEHLHVIASTARSRAEDRARCLAAGMDDFLTKPIQPETLWAAMSRVSQAAEQSSRVNIRTDALLAACEGDARFLDELRDALRERLREDLASVDRALSEGDSARLREAAHSLSGMLSVFSVEAGDLAFQLEELAARGELLHARSLVQRLRDYAPRLTRAVAEVSIESLRRDASS